LSDWKPIRLENQGKAATVLVLPNAARPEESQGPRPPLPECRAAGRWRREFGGVALPGGEVFPPELVKKATAPAWKDCPPGTVAYSHAGTRWTKQENGWWRANGGDAFPIPGADAGLVRLPDQLE
jgi:hypothetical protein